MSNSTIIYLVAGGAGLLSLIAWVAWVLVPAWTSYSRLGERLVATVLSIYVLAAFVVVGVGLGAAVLYYYDEL